jgi:hypothetical protein
MLGTSTDVIGHKEIPSQWWNGGMAEWHMNGRMAEWHNGRMAGMAEWSNGRMARMAEWHMEWGMTDGMAEWQNGRVFEESCKRESRVGEGVVAKRSSTRG